MLGSSGAELDNRILGEVMENLSLHLPSLTTLMQGTNTIKPASIIVINYLKLIFISYFCWILACFFDGLFLLVG